MLKLSRFIWLACFTLADAALLTPGHLSAQTPEATRLLCQGELRTTARIYQNDSALIMRLYDRQNRMVWFNAPARSETNPEVVTYSNIRGEQSILITVNRNDPTLCSIQIGNQPLERGTASQVQL